MQFIYLRVSDQQEVTSLQKGRFRSQSHRVWIQTVCSWAEKEKGTRCAGVFWMHLSNESLPLFFPHIPSSSLPLLLSLLMSLYLPPSLLHAVLTLPPSRLRSFFFGKHLLADIFIPRPEYCVQLCFIFICRSLKKTRRVRNSERSSRRRVESICVEWNRDAQAEPLHGASEASPSSHYCVHLCNITLLCENIYILWYLVRLFLLQEVGARLSLTSQSLSGEIRGDADVFHGSSYKVLWWWCLSSVREEEGQVECFKEESAVFGRVFYTFSLSWLSEKESVHTT